MGLMSEGVSVLFNDEKHRRTNNWIALVKIFGLWRSYSFKKKLSSVNLFYGVNGTGKTTVLNLIAAVIQVNLKELDSVVFELVELKFDNIEDNSCVDISVQKGVDDDGFCYSYKIKKGGNEVEYKCLSKTESSYDFDSEDDSYFYYKYHRDRKNKDRIFNNASERYVTESYGDFKDKFESLSKIAPERVVRYELSNLINLSWLTIDRGHLLKGKEEMNAVDQKVLSLVSDLQNYVFELKQKQIKLNNDFQRNVFTFFLDRGEKCEFLKKEFEEINWSNERKLLEEIAQAYSLDDFGRRIETYINKSRELIKLMKKGESLDSSLCFDFFKTHSVVKKWEDQRTKIVNLYSDLNRFLKKINEMFHQKEMFFEEDFMMFSIQTTCSSKRPLRFDELSSGEKQLFILFCEALLQKGKPWVYMADEPEISLHVAWQDKIIDSLREINKNAQIIFATHSPDIIGRYSDFSYDMEELIKCH